MMNDALETEVLDLVASTLNLDRQLLTPLLTIEELGMDSLDVLKMTFAVEKRFQLSLVAYGFADVGSLSQLIQILRKEIPNRVAAT